MVLGEQADLHFTYISAVERGKRNVSLDAMSRIAEALGVDLWLLLRPEK